MKLRNKKTGGIDDFKIEATGLEWLGYTSLKEFCEEWEDVPEEPKTHWMIDTSVLEPVREIAGNPYEIDKEIGNWFSTKEEAEKAVEKLKAYKRLKDKGFRFDSWDENHHNLGIIEFSFSDVKKSVYDFNKDLDLLFGGEK